MKANKNKWGYHVAKRHHKGKFIGWEVWAVHDSCAGDCCPKVIASFYGKGAKANAYYFNQERMGG